MSLGDPDPRQPPDMTFVVQMSQIPHSPFSVQVHPAVPDAGNSKLDGLDDFARQCAAQSSTGLPNCGAPPRTALSFAVTVNDRFGNKRSHDTAPSDDDQVSLTTDPSTDQNFITTTPATWDPAKEQYMLSLTGKEVRNLLHLSLTLPRAC